MTIASLIDTPSELTDSSSSKSAIVLMTRIRLARNLAGQPFPGWAKPAQREKVLEACRDAVAVDAADEARPRASASTSWASWRSRSSSSAT